MSKYILTFYPDRGGLGDSIVGCSSAFILSKVLKINFKINPGVVKFDNYFDIPNIYINNKREPLNFNYEPSINHDDLFKTTNLDIFKNKNIHITSGSNFSRFLYKNKNFKDLIDIPEINIINYLFKNILMPKKKYLEKLDYYITKYNLKQSICVQIRVGNLWRDSFYNNPLTDKTYKRFIKCIKENNKNNNNIILVTDNLNFVKNIFIKNNLKNIINIDGNITHSIKSNKIDYEKTLLDMLIIGECKNVILSYWSNYGRVGVLRTLHSNFFLVEPTFIYNNNKKLWRDKNDPEVIEYRRGELKEILSKDCSYI